jgi:hypothetical protein
LPLPPVIVAMRISLAMPMDVGTAKRLARSLPANDKAW